MEYGGLNYELLRMRISSFPLLSITPFVAPRGVWMSVAPAAAQGGGIPLLIPLLLLQVLAPNWTRSKEERRPSVRLSVLRVTCSFLISSLLSLRGEYSSSFFLRPPFHQNNFCSQKAGGEKTGDQRPLCCEIPSSFFVILLVPNILISSSPRRPMARSRAFSLPKEN